MKENIRYLIEYEQDNKTYYQLIKTDDIVKALVIAEDKLKIDINKIVIMTKLTIKTL